MDKILASLAACAFAVLVLAPAAGAATEFGSNCAGIEGEPGFTVLDLAHSSSEPLPAAAPVSGVITQGKTTFEELAPPRGVSVLMQVYRPAGANQVTLVGEAPSVAVSPGTNTFATRVPVQAGDHLGFSVQAEGNPIGLFCRSFDPGDLLAYTEDPPGLGGTAGFGVADEFRTPVAAVIEPDADSDGYGDETQDGCPQSAALQTPCSLIAVDLSAKAGKKAVTVTIKSSAEGSVGVKGVIKLGKGKKATLKAKTKTVFPGKIASFRLKYNAKLIKRLKELEPGKKLTLKVTATATNVAGQVTTDKLKVKLKGQGK